MTDPTPTLSVCIPTFNRLAYLTDALDSLLPQASDLGVQVFVSDNDSDDGTKGYLNDIAQRFPCLRHQSNRTNIGLEKNMIAALQGATGDYVLPIGDDEVLLPGSLAQILDAIKKHHPYVLVLNGWHTDAKLTPKREHLPNSLKGSVFSDPETAFSNLWDKTPPGSVVIRRALLTESNFDRFLGTSHAYAGAFWAGLSETFQREGHIRLRCMDRPTVLLRAGEKTWHQNSARIKLYEIPLWLSILTTVGFDPSADRVLQSYLERNSQVPALLRQKVRGGFDWPLYEQLDRFYSVDQLDRMDWVLKTPTPMSEGLHYLFNGASKIGKAPSLLLRIAGRRVKPNR